MNFWKVAFFAGWGLCGIVPQKLYAEEFLEEVYDENAPSGPEATPKEESRKKAVTDDSPESPWTFGLGLGGGRSGFSGTFRAHYHVNKVIVPEIGLSHLSFRTDEFSHKESAIETPVMLLGANPTPFWPFVGAGPGFVRWQQSDPVGTYDDQGSLTGFYLYGLLLKFSKQFALVIENKTVHYLGATPVKKVIDRGLPTEDLIYGEDTISAYSFYFQLNL